MKKVTFLFLSLIALFISNNALQAQQIKVGVFDIDLMVQAMPSYRQVDSMVQIYEKDSRAPEYEIYQSEYMRLDKAYKIDSADVAEGKKSKKVLDYTAEQRQKMGLNIMYWQQMAQNKSTLRRNQLARPLYEQVVIAYKKVLDKYKYAIVLKPQTYEFGFRIENIFVPVAKELKLRELPQEIIALGEDPDVQAAAAPASSNKNKPKAN